MCSLNRGLTRKVTPNYLSANCICIHIYLPAENICSRDFFFLFVSKNTAAVVEYVFIILNVLYTLDMRYHIPIYIYVCVCI